MDGAVDEDGAVARGVAHEEACVVEQVTCVGPHDEGASDCFVLEDLGCSVA